ncbi:hypothetical protein V2W30_20975 [Streptomyces sp. Q6]|uniref:Uncharacterized protein n=1 Tax=Streptomyces citrinus TaxID=3118173 RepID=A0ACD5APE5_9ACTN
MDLLDWHRGQLSSRRLAILVRHLPRDGAFAHALHGEAATWGVTDHLLAHMIDQLAESNWMFAVVNQGEDADPPEFPTPLKRPADRLAAESEPAPADAGRAGLPAPEEVLRFLS